MKIELDRLSKRFARDVALADVSETIESGALVALLGPSGCGKTTLLRLIAGLEEPDSGVVRFDGIDVTNLPLRERNVGFVFQSYALFPHLDVAGNIGFGLTIRGASRHDAAVRVDELLELVHLTGFGKRRPHELSGGQRQRVALARALASGPRILLLDEPFAALDLQVRKELRRSLRDLHEQTGVTTLIVTHDAEEAMEIADRIVVLHQGRVQQSDIPQRVYDAPANPFVMQFFGSVNVLSRRAAEPVYVRPHEFRIETSPFEDAVAGSLARVTALGASTRLECILADGQRVTTEVGRARVAALRPKIGMTLYVAPERTYPFTAAHI